MSKKISFDSLKSNKMIEKIKTIKVGDTEIEVKQYLPIEKKLALVGEVVSALASGNKYNFVNPIHLDVYSTVEIIKAYTNIEFAGEALPAEIYDTLEVEDLANKIISAIPEVEYKFVMEGIEKTINAYYNYNNSVLGILEAVNQDYSNLNLDATEIKDKISNPENLTLLKDVMTKLG